MDQGQLIADLEQHLLDQFTQSWQHELSVTMGKLRTYKMRYYLPNALAVEERTCWFCENGSVEYECHFLFNCKLYTETTDRKDLMCYCRALNASFEHLTSIDKLQFISSSNDNTILLYFCKYVSSALNLR